MKKIGILTSGGDCSGLNSIIRAAFLRTKELGFELIGIRYGVKGLADRPYDIVKITDQMCCTGLLTMAGSILKSNTKSLEKSLNISSRDTINSRILDAYNELGLEGVIWVGGDGSLGIINEQFKKFDGFNFVAIPKTIDNDVSITDYSVGFFSAIEVATEAIENISTTARSHDRVMVIETMGRYAGFIALYAGIASGADIILTQEFPYSKENLVSKVKSVYNEKGYCIIVASEAVPHPLEGFQYTGQSIAQFIQNKTHIDSRNTILGHIQRGGKTSVIDRLLASSFAVEAVNLIRDKKFCRVVCLEGGKVTSKPLEFGTNSISKNLSNQPEFISVAKNLGIYVGEI